MPTAGGAWKAALGRTRKILGRLRYEHSILFALAILIGAATGYGAIGFRLLIDIWGVIGFAASEQEIISGAARIPWWRMLLTPVAGGLIVALILRLFLPEGRPHGVAEVIESVAIRDGRLKSGSGLMNAIANATALGFGSSVGREGPVVHLAAVIGASFARLFRLSPAVSRTLIGCAVASGVAASFNAPIAGVIFALEVVVGHYALHAFAPIVIAGVAGTMVSRAHLGNNPAFTIPPVEIVSTLEFPLFGLLGVMAALAAILFMSSVFRFEDLRQKLPTFPDWALPPFAGVIVGLVAIGLPELIGVGYQGTDTALKNGYALPLLLLLFGGKLLLTAFCLAARFGTGVFSPSLFIGAMLGGAFGLAAAGLYPGEISNAGVYAVVGMGAFAAAVLGAPMSTILIIFELTGDYEVTLAVMVAAALSSLITHFAFAPSFFLAQLERRGLSLEAGKASHLLKSSGVKGVMRTDFATVQREASLADIKQMLIAQGGGSVLVTDETGALAGIVSLSALPDDAFDPQLGTLIRADDVLAAAPVELYASDNLERAMRLLEQSGERQLPVLSNSRDRVVIGILDRQDVLDAYNRALLEAQGREPSA